MSKMFFEVTAVANGYTVSEIENKGDVSVMDDARHIALTQDEVAKVVKGLLRGSFGDEKKEAKKKPRKKAAAKQINDSIDRTKTLLSPKATLAEKHSFGDEKAAPKKKRKRKIAIKPGMKVDIGEVFEDTGEPVEVVEE